MEVRELKEELEKLDQEKRLVLRFPMAGHQLEAYSFRLDREGFLIAEGDITIEKTN